MDERRTDDAPELRSALALAAREVRLAAAGRTGVRVLAVSWCACLLVVAAGVVEPQVALPLLPTVMGLGIVAPLLGAAAVFALTPRCAPARAAREIERRLGIDDRVSCARALVAGEVASPLGGHVILAAETTLARSRPALRTVFARRPGRSERRVLLGLVPVLAALVTLLFLARDAGVPWSFEGFGGGAAHAKAGPAGDEESHGTAEGRRPDSDAPDPDADPDAPPDGPEPPEPGEDPPLPPGPADAGARARLLSTRDVYRAEEPVMLVVAATPTADLARETRYTVVLEVDGVRCAAPMSLAVSPDRPEGESASLDLRFLPGAAEKLEPGTHKARAILDPGDGTGLARSDEVEFRVEGRPKSDDEDKGGEPPPPQPGLSEAPPPPAPTPEPDRPDPTAFEPAGDIPPPPEAPPPPPLDTGFEKKVVVPLFGEGEEVEKTGPVVVLRPGSSPAAGPESVPLGDALPDAVRRAESQVDRGRVRPADRALVLRYFERLARRVR